MEKSYLSQGAALFLVGFLVTYLLTPVVRVAATWLKIVDEPDERRINMRATPRGGGVAVFLGFHAACALLFLVFGASSGALLSMRWWLGFLPASCVLLAVGLVDDCRGLPPWVKLTGQTVAATLFWVSGQGICRFLNWDMPVGLDFLFTLLWILVITNAFNLIDGMDGLATGLGIISAVGMCGALLFRGYPGDSMVLLGLAGACVAFLRFNFHPATIFLGDSGSMFLGFVLATIALSTGSKGAAAASIGVPLMAVGIPIFDVMLAVWRRSVRHFVPPHLRRNGNGNGITDADADHLHHRLLRRGFSQKQAASLLYAFSGLLVIVALLSLARRSLAAGLYVLAFAGGCYVVVRHLATVELWDTGIGILSGLKRPTRKMIAVITYPLMDVAILAGAWAAATGIITCSSLGIDEWRLMYVSSVPLWVGIPFLFMILGQTYRRVWSRARAMDFVVLVWTIISGVVAALGVDALLSGGCTFARFVEALVYASFVLLLATGVRAFFVSVRDAITVMSQMGHGHGMGKSRTVILYGGGVKCTYFLKSRHDGILNGDYRTIVHGIIDDDPNLRGRLVCSVPVLGGLCDLPALASKNKPDEVIVTTDLADGRMEQLLDWAHKESVIVSEWTMERRIMQDSAKGGRD